MDNINIDIYSNNINLDIKNKQSLDFNIENFALINNGGNSGFTNLSDTTITNLDESIIDECVETINSVKYYIYISSNTKKRNIEINAIKNTEVDYVTNAIGDNFNVIINLNIVSNKIVLSITNNEVDDITIKCSKIYL
jgi:hypothetical protein